jgi:hypothetical protein
MTVKQAIPAMINWLADHKIGEQKVNYKLRDWVFSRQRYWGEPIPMINCEKCGWVPVPEDQLPLVLPNVESYEPTDDGESPLAKMTDWVNTTCPQCGGPAKRETDTMPNWAGSSWYWLRYMDPHNDEAFCSPEAEQYWGPVDWYNGGMEHTTLHLLYSRFWHKFLYDIGVVHTKEPYAKRTSHGMILGQNPYYVGNCATEEEKQEMIAKHGSLAQRASVKMSKSLGNVVNPDDVIKAYGAGSAITGAGSAATGGAGTLASIGAKIGIGAGGGALFGLLAGLGVAGYAGAKMIEANLNDENLNAIYGDNSGQGGITETMSAGIAQAVGDYWRLYRDDYGSEEAMNAREALLRELEAEGYVNSEQGVGLFENIFDNLLKENDIDDLLAELNQSLAGYGMDGLDLPADWWQSGGSTDGLTSDDISGFRSLPGQMKAAVQQGVNGIRVYMDGETVGRLVTPYVSEQIARDAV